VSDRRILAAKVNAQLIAPDERYTVVVDFTGTSGKWVLSNDAATPTLPGTQPWPPSRSSCTFDVNATLVGKDSSVILAKITETNNVQLPADILKTARLRTVQAAEMSEGCIEAGPTPPGAPRSWCPTPWSPPRRAVGAGWSPCAPTVRSSTKVVVTGSAKDTVRPAVMAWTGPGHLHRDLRVPGRQEHDPGSGADQSSTDRALAARRRATSHDQREGPLPVSTQRDFVLPVRCDRTEPPPTLSPYHRDQPGPTGR